MSGPPTHPIVLLAMDLVARPAPTEPALTAAGRDQLAAALRAYRGPDLRAAALALLELAYFLAGDLRARAAAEAIGAVVVAQAGDELRGLGEETRQGSDLRAEAARRFLGAATPAPATSQVAGEAVRSGPILQFTLRGPPDET